MSNFIRNGEQARTGAERARWQTLFKTPWQKCCSAVVSDDKLYFESTGTCDAASSPRKSLIDRQAIRLSDAGDYLDGQSTEAPLRRLTQRNARIAEHSAAR
jgi:hypothetical protein